MTPDPFDVLLSEIRRKRATIASIARLYTAAIDAKIGDPASGPRDPRWLAVNMALIDRGGPRYRERVKREAWRLLGEA
jgi:hypothetical protein